MHSHLAPLQSPYRHKPTHDALQKLNLFQSQLDVYRIDPNADVKKLLASEDKSEHAKGEKYQELQRTHKELNRNFITSASLYLVHALGKVLSKTHVTESLEFFQELQRINHFPPSMSVQEDLQLMVVQRVFDAINVIPNAQDLLDARGVKPRALINLSSSERQPLFENFQNLDFESFQFALVGLIKLISSHMRTLFTAEDLRLLNCAAKMDRLSEQVSDIISRLKQIDLDHTIGFPEHVLKLIKKTSDDISKLFTELLTQYPSHTLDKQESLLDKFEAALKKLCNDAAKDLVTIQGKNHLEKNASLFFDRTNLLRSQSPPPARPAIANDKAVIKASHSLKQLHGITELRVILQGYGQLSDTQIEQMMQDTLQPRNARSQSVGSATRGIRSILSATSPLAEASKENVGGPTIAPLTQRGRRYGIMMYEHEPLGSPKARRGLSASEVSMTGIMSPLTAEDDKEKTNSGNKLSQGL